MAVKCGPTQRLNAAPIAFPHPARRRALSRCHPQPAAARSCVTSACRPAAAKPAAILQHSRRTYRYATRSAAQAQTASPAVDFDLALAVALAGVAFESYLEPTGAEGFQELSVNGCETTYTDRTFLANTYDGILQVKLHCGKNLPAADINGKSDPYAVLSVGDSTGTSKIKYAQLNPVWNESFYLYVRSKEEDVLKVRVFDKDLFSADDDLGLAMRGLQDLDPGRPLRLELPLRGTTPDGAGTVELSITFLPFSAEGALTELVTADDTEMPTVTPAEAVAADIMAGSSAIVTEVAATTASLAAAAVQGAAAQPGVAAAAEVVSGSAAVARAGLEPVADVVGETLEALKEQLKEASRKLDEVAGGGEGLSEKAQRVAAEKLRDLVGDISAPGTFAAASEKLKQITKDLETSISQMEVPSDVQDSLDSGVQKGSAIVQQLKGALGPLLEAASAASSSGPEDPTAMAGTQVTLPAPEELPGAWRVLARVAGKQIEDHFTPVAFIENHETDTQVWLYRNPTAREMVIAFRGTEQVKWKDFVTDLNLTPAAFNPERVDSNAGKPWLMRALQIRKDEPMVHSGFLGAYDSVKARVVKLLELILASDRSGPWRVFVTGHSLGGALATISSYELSAYFATAGRPHQVTMYTYGAPRVGNNSFASAFNEAVPDSWRITNINDIIPTVPRLMGYCHVRHGAKLQPDGSLLVEMDSADVFGEGKHAEDVMSELVQRVQAGGAAWEDIAEEIKANEMQVLEGLIAGRAIEEHLETFYLQALRQLVVAAVPGAEQVLEEEMARLVEDAVE